MFGKFYVITCSNSGTQYFVAQLVRTPLTGNAIRDLNKKFTFCF